MKHLFFFLSVMLFAFLTLTAQETGGPYTVDANTVLLMHFDNNLAEEASNLTVNDIGKTKAYIVNQTNGLGYGIHFDNSDEANASFLTVSNSPALNMTGSWTIEFWFVIESWDQSHNNWPVPITLPTTGWDANYFLEIPASEGRLKYGFTCSDGQPTVFSSTNSISAGVEYHVALINDYENNQIKLVLHNVDFEILEEQSYTYTPGTTISTGTQDLKIGNGIAGDNFFNGYMDELRISNCVRNFSPVLPTLPPMQTSTSNIEFYSSPEDAANLTAIVDAIQEEYVELSSFWDRPGKTPLLPEGTKIKMYLLNRSDFLQYSGSSIPDWKCGWFDKDTYTVIVTPLVGEKQEDYYGTFESLAKGSLAQMMLKLKLVSQNNNSNPTHFLEGFGLYRGGYRPNTDMILQSITDLGRLPKISDIQNTQDYTTGYMKDLITSYVECQLLANMAYQGLATWVGTATWHPYLQYYHQMAENERMMLRGQSENFNIYCTAQDVQFLEAIKSKLEEKLARYSTLYQMTVNNRFNIVVFPSEAAAMACMSYDGYNGGSGNGGDKLDILSPVVFVGGIAEATYSLIPHEFFHVFHNHMTPDPHLINGFYTEGMAEIMAYEGTVLQYLQNRDWYFLSGLQRFNQENGRDPKLADIIPDSDGYMSVYSYGMAFWHYMLQNHATHIELKEFFNERNDWNVFDASYEVIDAGYINFLRSLAGLSTDVVKEKQLPNNYKLYQNYPNPFNPTTEIVYEIPSQIGKDKNVELSVYNSLGERVKTLVNKNQASGLYRINFNAEDLPSGVYYYSLQVDAHSEYKKMVLLK